MTTLFQRILERRVKQDDDIEDKKGSQPAKYHSGLDKSTKQKRDAHFKAKRSGPAPGDEGAKTKKSVHTKKYEKMYGKDSVDENVDVKKALKKVKGLTTQQMQVLSTMSPSMVQQLINTMSNLVMSEDAVIVEKIEGLVKKSKKSGISYGILKKVYDRGMAAYKTGHRPGTTAQQWAFARVNSFITKGSGTWGKADKDLANKVRGESLEENLGFRGTYRRKSKYDGKEFDAKKEFATLKKIQVALDKADKIHQDLQYPNTVDAVTHIWEHINKAYLGTFKYMDQIRDGKYDGKIDMDESFEHINEEVPESLKNQIKQAQANVERARKFYSNSSDRRDGKSTLRRLKNKVWDAEDKLEALRDRAERLREELTDEDFTLPEACWDGYKQVGLKKKGKKMVPDCVPEDRDYKKEYDNYHSDPEQIKRRSKRNQARRSLEDSKQDIKGKDVHHKDNNPMNNDKSNLSVVSKNYNRKEPRLREKLLRQGILKNGKTRK